MPHALAIEPEKRQGFLGQTGAWEFPPGMTVLIGHWRRLISGFWKGAKMATTEKLPEVMTDAEVADFLRVSEVVVRNYAARAMIPGRQIDGQWRFSRAAIEEWLTARSSKEILLSQVGAMEDDVKTLEEIRDSVVRDRRGPNVEQEKD